MTVTLHAPEVVQTQYPVPASHTRIPAFVDASFRKIDRLSSGHKLDRSQIDPSILRSEQLRHELARHDIALRASTEAFTMAGIADGALGEMTEILKDVRAAVLDASVATARGQVSPGQPEIDAALSRLDSLVDSTSFSGQPILDGSRSLEFSQTPSDGTPSTTPFVDVDATRIDQVANPDKAVVTISFTPESARVDASATPEQFPEGDVHPAPAPIPAPVSNADVVVEPPRPTEASAPESASAQAEQHITLPTSAAPEPVRPDVPVAPTRPEVPESPDALMVEDVPDATLEVEESVPSEPAQKAVIEADSARPDTDSDGVVVTAPQEFILSGVGGSRLFTFPADTSLGAIAESIDAHADLTGVTATLVFASDVHVDVTVPVDSSVDAPTIPLTTVYPASSSETVVESTAESVPTPEAPSTLVKPDAPESEPQSEPDQVDEERVFHPSNRTTEQPESTDPREVEPSHNVLPAEPVAPPAPVPSSAPSPVVPEVRVAPAFVEALVPGRNCDADGCLYIERGADADEFVVYADAECTRVVGTVADGVFQPTGESSLHAPGGLVVLPSSDESSSEGDVFVLAFAGLELANDHDVNLSGDVSWVQPEGSFVTGIRLQENTSRDGEIIVRYEPITQNEEGEIESFVLAAYTSPECTEDTRVAESGVVVVQPKADADVVPVVTRQDVPVESGTPVAPEPRVIPTPHPTEPTEQAGEDIPVADIPTPSPERQPETEPVKPECEVVRLSPVVREDGSDSELYMTVRVDTEALPDEAADFSIECVNLGIRVSSREYGSTETVTIQNREGRLWSSPRGDRALVQPGATIQAEGSDATVVIAGQPVRTHGLVADVDTPDVSGTFTLTEGEVGSPTVAVVGYDEGSLATAAGRLDVDNAPPAVRHEPSAVSLTIASEEPAAQDGLRDNDRQPVQLELDFTRLEPSAPAPQPAPAQPVPAAASVTPREPVEKDSAPRIPVDAVPVPERKEAPSSPEIKTPEETTSTLEKPAPVLSKTPEPKTESPKTHPTIDVPQETKAPAPAATPSPEERPSEMAVASKPIEPVVQTDQSSHAPVPEAPIDPVPAASPRPVRQDIPEAKRPSVHREDDTPSSTVSQRETAPVEPTAPSSIQMPPPAFIRKAYAQATPQAVPASPEKVPTVAVTDSKRVDAPVAPVAPVAPSASVAPVAPSASASAPVADSSLVREPAPKSTPVVATEKQDFSRPPEVQIEPRVRSTEVPAPAVAETPVSPREVTSEVASTPVAPEIVNETTTTAPAQPVTRDGSVSTEPSAPIIVEPSVQVDASTPPLPEAAAAAPVTDTDTNTDAKSATVREDVPPSQTPEPAADDDVSVLAPLGPLRVASVTTPKSVTVEYVGDGTLKITCVTMDESGKPMNEVVVMEKIDPDHLRAGYYVTHPGLRGLFIKTSGTISLDESRDPFAADPITVMEKTALPLEGATSDSVQPHQARREELHSFRGGVPVAGPDGNDDDAVYAIQSLELDEIGRVVFGGKDYSLADVKLGGAANLAGNSLLTLQILAKATSDISALRERLGAYKANVLEHNIKSLDVTIENIAVTEHAIRDRETAEERVGFTRGMMLEQSGTSILAQANQMVANVYSLLY